MIKPIEVLNQWLTGIDGQYPADWSLLPDIGLYMDQVQTYIDRQLGLYRRDEQDRLLTPAMINNYIKDDLIPRAESKKYSPVHLALLIMIATLKQVLSMQHLNRLLSGYRKTDDVSALYAQFLTVQHQCLQDSVTKVREETKQLLLSTSNTPDSTKTEINDKAQTDALREMALELSIEARTKILIAEKILSILNEDQEPAEIEAKKSENRKKEKSR
ncbi:MAG: DUF1836 domain-containing protein [Bacillota bacterium]|nr:DUF1836 domain-containing protein [Bacillota bacterium]